VEPVPGLDGAVVVVTGAGSGIGRATALLLAASGAVPVLVARRPETLDEVAGLIRAAGGRSLSIPADVSTPAAPADIVARTVAGFGRVDGLVNNAAIVRHHPIAEWTMDGFDEHLDTNVRAPYFLIQASLPHLVASGHGSVVNISSSSGTLRRTGQSVYGMTKAALDYLTSSLAGELAPMGVRVNGIAPGPVDTPIHATWADDLAAAHVWLAGQVPLGRIGTAEELARWIALLLSPTASFVTGAVIPVDGGQVIDRE
jgi:C-7 ketoreductase